MRARAPSLECHTKVTSRHHHWTRVQGVAGEAGRPNRCRAPSGARARQCPRCRAPPRPSPGTSWTGASTRAPGPRPERVGNGEGRGARFVSRTRRPASEAPAAQSAAMGSLTACLASSKPSSTGPRCRPVCPRAGDRRGAPRGRGEAWSAHERIDRLLNPRFLRFGNCPAPC